MIVITEIEGAANAPQLIARYSDTWRPGEASQRALAIRLTQDMRRGEVKLRRLGVRSGPLLNRLEPLSCRENRCHL